MPTDDIAALQQQLVLSQHELWDLEIAEQAEKLMRPPTARNCPRV